MDAHRGTRPKKTAPNPPKIGWRVAEFAASVGLCRASIYNEMGKGRIDWVKSGSATIITTTPADYLASLSDKQSA